MSKKNDERWLANYEVLTGVPYSIVQRATSKANKQKQRYTPSSMVSESDPEDELTEQREQRYKHAYNLCRVVTEEDESQLWQTR